MQLVNDFQQGEGTAQEPHQRLPTVDSSQSSTACSTGLPDALGANIRLSKRKSPWQMLGLHVREWFSKIEVGQTTYVTRVVCCKWYLQLSMAGGWICLGSYLLAELPRSHCQGSAPWRPTSQTNTQVASIAIVQADMNCWPNKLLRRLWLWVLLSFVLG
eukprot:1141962-Pelagomonas_calceolata.AAC.4